jgi:hypothetical protein
LLSKDPKELRNELRILLLNTKNKLEPKEEKLIEDIQKK